MQERILRPLVGEGSDKMPLDRRNAATPQHSLFGESHIFLSATHSRER